MARFTWGEPDGIPEGSDFRVELLVSLNGGSSGATSSGTYTLSVQDSVLNGGTAVLADEASDSKSTVNGRTLVAWEILDSQTAATEAGVYPTDVKLVDSATLIRYFRGTTRFRAVVD